jgi:protoporphyrinogen oxidase
LKITILGAGLAGLSAAYDLARSGHSVTVFEAAAQAGGLASGFSAAGWDWSLERFYHHIFESDRAILELAEQIGARDLLFFRAPTTAQWWQGRGYALDGVGPVLRFPGLAPLDRIRFGATAFFLKYLTSDWRRLEQHTAMDWTTRVSGRAVAETIWRPLLQGKFGPYAEDVNMAWLWARLRARTFKLGYVRGGFQAFTDALQAAVERSGGQVFCGRPVSGLAQQADGSWLTRTSDGAETASDAVLVTGAPGLLARLAPQLPAEYLGRLRELRSMGAVVLTVALKQSLTNGIYWLNVPKPEFPFLALVEHTRLIEPEHYGGDHLVYLGDYVPADHEYLQLSSDELLERFLPALQRINPQFQPEWVRAHWLHREAYAQPIVPVGHSANIPPIATPLRGLYWASMSQVYPWDRGTNFAVEIGRDAARVMSGTGSGA